MSELNTPTYKQKIVTLPQTAYTRPEARHLLAGYFFQVSSRTQHYLTHG